MDPHGFHAIIAPQEEDGDSEVALGGGGPQ